MKRIAVSFLVLILFLTTLSFGNQAEAAEKYKDISSNHWAAKEIEYLSNKGVIGGFKDGTFKPNANVTKAQASIMIVRALGLNLNNRPNPNFADVGTGSTSYKSIATMIDEGYFSKTSKFYPRID
ncbi:S-layer homology domain-containing protein [Domibacillus tundrae]|uniref:S-layer homology domain-containing protein n=1 Tax=Domibacillus tundrae TaxID=1587527 RepID=UPI00069788F0|nr:S-layer homology domain-containing protein [Domibacillus tundrae]